MVSIEFVTDITRVEGLKRYWEQELRKDISTVPEDARSVVQKHLDGESLSPQEDGVYKNVLKVWWHNKYGFPFDLKPAREQLLRKKYGLPQEQRRAQTLQEKLLDAYGVGDAAALERLKKEYKDTFPDELEGVEVLFGIERYLKDQEIVRLGIYEGKTTIKKLQNLTEYNFLLTHFILQSKGNSELLAKFWKVLEAIAGKAGYKQQFRILRAGALTQVAAYRIFEQLNLRPQLSHPVEDAFDSVDLWTDTATRTAAVQVKSVGKRQEQDAMFVKTDSVVFPGMRVSEVQARKRVEQYHMNSYLFLEAQRFNAKLSKYKKRTGKNVEGYFVVIPYQKVDFITGEPDPGLVQLAKERINTELK